MDIARGDEAWPETLSGIAAVIAAQGQDVLGRAFGTVIEGRHETIPALPSIPPGLQVVDNPRHGEVAPYAGLDMQPAGFCRPGLALTLGNSSRQAALLDDLSCPDTGWQIAGGGRRTVGFALLVIAHCGKVKIAFRIAMTGEDFEQQLIGWIVLSAHLPLPVLSWRGVDPPGGAMRYHHGLMSPLPQFGKQFGRGSHALQAVGGQTLHWHPFEAVSPCLHGCQQGCEIKVARASQSHQSPLPGAWQREFFQALGRDGASGDLIGAGSGKNHIAMTVVVARIGAHLCPLPAQEGNEVWIFVGACQLVAVAHCGNAFPPVLRQQLFGMIGQSPKIKPGAVAGKVTGIRRRMGPFAKQERQAHGEGVIGKRAVNMQVPEEDLLVVRRQARKLPASFPLSFFPLSHVSVHPQLGSHCIFLDIAQPAPGGSLIKGEQHSGADPKHHQKLEQSLHKGFEHESLLLFVLLNLTCGS